jgi:hypothetical protein
MNNEQWLPLALLDRAEANAWLVLAAVRGVLKEHGVPERVALELLR